MAVAGYSVDATEPSTGHTGLRPPSGPKALQTQDKDAGHLSSAEPERLSLLTFSETGAAWGKGAF